MKSLYLAWQAPSSSSQSRAWFPVGRLDAEPSKPSYRFRYTHGAINAHDHLGFEPLLSFPDFHANYRSDELFPLFKNRVISDKRTDFEEYISWLDLDRGHADPIEILSVSGGSRMTDSLEVFPRVNVDPDGRFRIRFFLHGLRHLSKTSSERASQLLPGDNLQVMIEMNNPATRIAISLLTEDYQMVGWAPRYLIEDLISCVPKAPELSASVAKVNADGAPPNQKILVDFEGCASEGHQPMSTPDFQPLISD